MKTSFFEPASYPVRNTELGAARPQPSRSGHPLALKSLRAAPDDGAAPVTTIGSFDPGTNDLSANDADSVLARRRAVRLAPLCRAIQKLFGRAEDALLPEADRGMAARPVFVTGLPCGGAGHAYRLLAGSRHYATFREGDGPFVAAPRTGRGCRTLLRSPLGDPAFLDEALWLACDGDVARQKRALARLGALEGHKRYMGKNTGLMSRLPAAREAFPDACFVAAFREPLAQIAAMPDDASISRADWLAYWIKAYKGALAEPGLVLLDTDRLWAEGRPIARRLAQATGTPECDAYLRQQGLKPRPVKAGTRSGAARFTVPSALLAEARALHWRLARAAI